MMMKIGEQLQEATGAFQCRASGPVQPCILDFCMAPGGFLAVALKHNPRARATAFSLDPKVGGHPILMPFHPRVSITLQDITMLAGDMGVQALPSEALDHPDADNFCFVPKLSALTKYDIVLCDGQVLRTHERASYREQSEATRLTMVQIALGLEHLRPGANMIVLLHKPERLYCMKLLEAFRKFSKIDLFKPFPQHAKRSSFYMVASNVQSGSKQAQDLVQQCKHRWRLHTFGTDAELETVKDNDERDAQRLIDDFGPELIRLAQSVWKKQTEALEKAPFIQDREI